MEGWSTIDVDKTVVQGQGNGRAWRCALQILAKNVNCMTRETGRCGRGNCDSGVQGRPEHRTCRVTARVTGVHMHES